MSQPNLRVSQPEIKLHLEDELKRLRVKLTASSDRDIKQALQLRIDGLEANLEKLTQAELAKKAEQESPEEQAPETFVEATSDQIRKADELIRQARVEKIRKNNARAATLMREAATVAPTSPAVLESVGDEFNDRKLYKEARDTYAKALRFAKNNVELEKKHAMAVLRAKGMSSFDAAMRSEGADPLFLSSESSLASGGGAVWLNAFVPGVGHLAVGKTAGGIALISATVIWIVWLMIEQKDLQGLIHMVQGKSSNPNLLVLIPIFGTVVTYIVGFTTLGAPSKRHTSRVTERPLPPIDLPFE